jgi:hypothetical protein
MGRDSAVSIANHNRLGGPGIKSQWGWNFPHPSRPALGPTQPPVQWVSCLFSRGKAARVLRWPSTPIQRWAFIASYRANFTFTLVTKHSTHTPNNKLNIAETTEVFLPYSHMLF